MLKKWKHQHFRSNLYKIILRDIKTDVCIVGAGPVGLTLANLLTKYKIPNIVIEKDSHISQHPKAHYISYKTMEYFKQINIEDSIISYITSIENWRYYSYCQYVLDNDSYLGKIDHFPNPTNTLNYLKTISNSTPIHLPQNKLCQIILQNLQNINKDNLYNKTLFSHRFIESYPIDGEDDLSIKVMDLNSNTEKKIECRYLVGSDGAHSKIREAIGTKINMIGDSHDFINFHFKSKSLASEISNKFLQSMLYFIFNEHHITVLIAYDLEEGEFVLQIPYYPPIQTIDDFDQFKCRNILETVLSKREKRKITDLEVMNISCWKLKNSLTEKLYKENIFLIGDSAHQFPPSGGYGLNTGIFDTFNLFWRLLILLKNKELTKNQIQELKDSFENECKINAKFVSICAELNFSKYMKIVGMFGLKTDYSKLLKNAIGAVIPKSLQKVTLEKTFSFGLYSLKFQRTYPIIQHLKESKNALNLLFPYVDYCVNYFNQSLNDPLKYENFEINFTDYLEEGYILPNFKIHLDQSVSIAIRDYLRRKLDKEYSFFVLKNTSIDTIEDNEIIFKGKIPLKSFEYKSISFSLDSKPCDFSFETNQELKISLSKIGLLIIRPDFIIEKIIKI